MMPSLTSAASKAMRPRAMSDVESQAETKLSEVLSNDAPAAVPDLNLTRQYHRTLERTNSIRFMSTPASRRVQPGVRLPQEFRTLSIQVTESHHGTLSPRSGKKRHVTDLAQLEWHKLSPDDLCVRVGVSPISGLDSAMVKRRLEKNGKNVISPAPRNLPKKIFFYVFGGFGSLLFGGAIVCFISWRPLGDPNPSASNLALAVVLVVVLFVQTFFNAWQDFTTSRVLASMSGLLPSDVLVQRDGNAIEIPASDLVLGDIIKIKLGAKVPADVRLIECSSDLQFDRSILTGESKPIPATVKNTDENFMESKNIALQGTLCTSGSGVGVCVELGDSTVFGRIAKDATRERPSKTTLEKEIQRFVIIIASLAFVVASMIVILWASWLRRDHPGFISVPVLLIDCVSVAIAFIPEGLPVCVTLSLTVIANAMRRKNILCKSLATVESLGCVSVICSDKTGTLTQNRMSVVNIAVGLQPLSIEDAKEHAEKSGPGNLVNTLAGLAGLCNDAVFSGSEEKGAERTINGDATDTGLLRFSDRFEDVNSLRHLWKEVSKIAFNSKNKFAIKLVKLTRRDPNVLPSPLNESDAFGGDDDMLLLVKGAPDILLPRCSSYVDSDGKIKIFFEKTVEEITAVQTNFAAQGQRVLLLTKKVIRGDSLDFDQLKEYPEDTLIALNKDLVIVGLVALVDPPKNDTPETVRLCRRAGIRFMMVTGDFPITASAIAKQCGIITAPAVHYLQDLPREKPLEEIPAFDPDYLEKEGPKALVLSGSDILAMTESQWKQALSFPEVVFARTTPQQKLQIVRQYQSAGATVAVTGDGVNDAPALKQADVGVAVAGGSEVAMEAADLILLEDFSAIIDGIEQGRLAFENLKKILLYLLPAGSFSELMPVIVNVLFGLPQALSNIQMILICTVTDVLPALSLVYEHPEADLLTRRPRDPRKDHLVDIKIIGQAYAIGVLESLTAMIAAFYFGFARSGIPFSSMWLKYGSYDVDVDHFATVLNRAQSMYFFNLVVMQWFNLLSTRTRRLSIFQQPPIGRSGNLFLFPAMFISLGCGIFFQYVPAIQRVFLTTNVPYYSFLLPVAYGIGVLALDETRKLAVRTFPGSFIAKIAW
ncbi:calcium ATPase [Meredithblackwellia eburnea MCA 4105]